MLFHFHAIQKTNHLTLCTLSHVNENQAKDGNGISFFSSGQSESWSKPTVTTDSAIGTNLKSCIQESTEMVVCLHACLKT